MFKSVFSSQCQKNDYDLISQSVFFLIKYLCIFYAQFIRKISNKNCFSAEISYLQKFFDLYATYYISYGKKPAHFKVFKWSNLWYNLKLQIILPALQELQALSEVDFIIY